ncbi:MAG: hypothetical protein QOJ94_1244 [Sphingomonadales bacterium]|jgi:hypothetical protein|nr:hypothetical protein [Sphingomonadales bacterium]
MASAAPPPTQPPPQRTGKISGEEYRLYYESTERVIDRRLSLNTWNYGICIAILVACGALANWGASKAEFRFLLLLGIIVIAAMGFVLSTYWVRQLRDYKMLNHAKFEVLNDMAGQVEFSDGGMSFEVFAKEWEILKARNATRKIRGMRIPALRSSSAEMIVPRAFGVLFLTVIAVVSLILFVNRETLLKHVGQLGEPEAASGAPTENRS